MKKYFSSLISQLSTRKGFTLIELLVVVFFIATVTYFGITSFVSYNRSQTLQQAVNDVSSLLTLAKSRALYQVKPDFCQTSSGISLDGYRLVVCPLETDPLKACIVGTADYEVDAVCGGNKVLVESRKLPPEVSFDVISAPSFFFPVLTGGVDRSGTLCLLGYGLSKGVLVDQIGGTSVQSEGCASPSLTPTITVTPTLGLSPTPTLTPVPPTPTIIPTPVPLVSCRLTGVCNINGRVFADTNRNGNLDPGETGYSGAFVSSSYSPSPCTSYSLDTSYNTQYPNPKKSDINGCYYFYINQITGCYRIEVTPPAGNTATLGSQVLSAGGGPLCTAYSDINLGIASCGGGGQPACPTPTPSPTPAESPPPPF